MSEIGWQLAEQLEYGWIKDWTSEDSEYGQTWNFIHKNRLQEFSDSSRQDLRLDLLSLALDVRLPEYV